MIICVSLYNITYYRSLNFRFVFDSRHGMPNAQCAVVGCTSSFADLRKWRKQKCVFHLIPKNNCPCRELYELLKFPKDEATKLSWEKRINRIETVDRTVRYGKRVFFHKKGEPWRANPTDVICSHHFLDDVPTEKTHFRTATWVTNTFTGLQSVEKDLCIEPITNSLKVRQTYQFVKIRHQLSASYQVTVLPIKVLLVLTIPIVLTLVNVKMIVVR